MCAPPTAVMEVALCRGDQALVLASLLALSVLETLAQGCTVVKVVKGRGKNLGLCLQPAKGDLG